IVEFASQHDEWRVVDEQLLHGSVWADLGQRRGLCGGNRRAKYHQRNQHARISHKTFPVRHPRLFATPFGCPSARSAPPVPRNRWSNVTRISSTAAWTSQCPFAMHQRTVTPVI